MRAHITITQPLTLQQIEQRQIDAQDRLTQLRTALLTQVAFESERGYPWATESAIAAWLEGRPAGRGTPTGNSIDAAAREIKKALRVVDTTHRLRPHLGNIQLAVTGAYSIREKLKVRHYHYDPNWSVSCLALRPSPAWIRNILIDDQLCPDRLLEELEFLRSLDLTIDAPETLIALARQAAHDLAGRTYTPHAQQLPSVPF